MMTPRTNASIVGILCVSLLTACATRQPQRPRRPTQLAEASPTPMALASATASTTPTPDAEATPLPRLEEGILDESSPGELEAPMVASVPKSAAEIPPLPATAPEVESLLVRITPQTAPNVAAALRLIEDGRAHLRQARYDQALERFERAVAIDPTSAYGYYFLAQLHYEMKKYDQAIAFASRAASLSAHSDRVCLGRAYGLQGRVFEEVGRYPDARRAYQRAVEADPNNAAARGGMVRLVGGGAN